VKLPATYSVGSSSHTGAVRVANEDDYLLGAVLPPRGETLLCAVADGMGGAAGGAEASRASLRALGAAVLDAESEAPIEQRLRDGFRAAGVRVFEEANSVPALRDMGTTLTALCLGPGHGWFGHVGDTRLYRLRGTGADLLTTDHAVREPDNLLTRCIGGGQPSCEADVGEFATEPGDRFVLVSDGVWSVVPHAELMRLSRTGSPQAAAEKLVDAALAAGGPDNATAVVVDVLSTEPAKAAAEVELPRDERVHGLASWPRPVSLRAPWWPWLVLCAALLMAAHAAVRWVFGIDGWVWLRSLW
jgi:protein phosphatase